MYRESNSSEHPLRQYVRVVLDHTARYEPAQVVAFLCQHRLLAEMSGLADRLQAAVNDAGVLSSRLYVEYFSLGGRNRKCLNIEVVRHDGEGYVRFLAKFALSPMSPHWRAELCANSVISVQVFEHAILGDAQGQDNVAASPLIGQVLQMSLALQPKPWTDKAAERDHLAKVALNSAWIARVYASLRDECRGRQEARGRERRDAHPWVGPMFQVLPTLISTRMPLRRIASAVPALAGLGFDNLFIGCVDNQTTEVFYQINEDGQLARYINNHGYWSDGRCELNPSIGSDEDYRHLTSELHRAGLGLWQDIVIGTLGYFRQTDDIPLAKVGSQRFDPKNPAYFSFEPMLYDDGVLGTDPEVTDYVDVVANHHAASPFALPKLNLYSPEVLQAALERPIWLVRKFGVSKFRLDMAKHIPLEALHAIIRRLRDAVECEGNDSFAMLLEYWSLNYRDLAFISRALETNDRGVYLYDFPLAASIQNCLIRGLPYFHEFDALLRARTRWRIDLERLIPFVIDHDFYFRPIYNGSEQSSAIQMVAFAICLFLGANGPCIYQAFDKADHGPAEIDEYFARGESHTRPAIEDVLDEGNVEVHDSMRRLLNIMRLHADLFGDANVSFDCSGGDDTVVLTRRPSSGSTTRRMTLALSRTERIGPPAPGVQLLFQTRSAPYVCLAAHDD